MARADKGIHVRKQRTAGIIMVNIITGEEKTVKNISEATRQTGISGTQCKRLIASGNMSIRGWVLDEVVAELPKGSRRRMAE